MKSVWALVFFAICAMLVVAFQAIKQERNIRRTRKEIFLNTEDVKIMEEKIVTSRMTLQKLSKELDPLDKQHKQLTKMMDMTIKKTENDEQTLNSCRMKKTDVEQEKSELSSSVDILRTSQNVEMQQMQEEIQRLKQQILGRDSMICTYVDTKQEKGRKLCADIKAASNQ
ncbi:uncharacterized protein si:dkey-87o1.2 [Silurus meridionalis]|uniref:Uncharacterized protein n=1 Tax=Silurus meridionalis TaxID=175797 RepID=A0A8T0BTF2_SILME|nr:uncharacterized protein si:dkey-87o1.2 [Silurus meridionalis]KAF7708600.1 hypothetical protein HF521_017657 [Silurus meridionalis]